MADTKVTLKVLLESAGIKPTQKQLDALNKEMQETARGTKTLSKEQNKLKRNLEGVAQRANRGEKDFSRMAQGMGGLVQIYATIAANVYALSSAFLVLRNAADLASMMLSAEDFSNRFGTSVQNITKRVQEATGGALTFAEALPTINKAISAGIGTEKIERLAIAATKASQTFGGTANEALNRFISASQRGRVEIIQTLGVVIKTEQAYKDYAAQIGKNATELSAFDRQQAILNATIEESAKVFDGVEIDPNPFQRLLTIITDVKDEGLLLAYKVLGPLADALNKSKEAAIGLLIILSRLVAVKFAPFIKEWWEGLVSQGLESTKRAKEISEKAARIHQEVELSVGRAINVGTEKGRAAMKRRMQLFRQTYAKQLKMHADFRKAMLNQDGSFNRQALMAQRAALSRELKARESGKGMQKAFVGIPTEVIRNEQRRLVALLNQQAKSIKAQENFNQAILRTTGSIKIMTAKYKDFATTVQATAARAKSGFLSGLEIGRGVVQGKSTRALRSIRVAFGLLVRDVKRGEMVMSKSFVNIGKLFGRLSGVFLGVAGKLVGALTTIYFAYLAVSVVIDIWKEKFSKSNQTLEKTKEALESLSDGLDDVSQRTEAFTATNTRAVGSFAEFIKRIEFFRGTLDTTLTLFTDFDKAVVEAFEGDSLDDVVAQYEYYNAALETSNELLKTNEQRLANMIAAQIRDADMRRGVNLQIEAGQRGVDIFTDKLENLDAAAQTVLENSGPALVRNFVSLTKAFDESNIGGFGEQAFAGLRKGLKDLEDGGRGFIQALNEGDTTQFLTLLNEMEGDTQGILTVFLALRGVIQDVGGDFYAATQQFTASSKQLQDLQGRITTFITGIDKVKAASVPNKEFFNFFLDTKNVLEDIQKQTETLGAGQAVEDAINREDLQVLRDFLGVGEGVPLEELIDAATSRLEVFTAVLNDQLTIQNKIKINNLELQTLKKEEASTDERRVEILEREQQIQKDNLQLQINRARNNLRALQIERQTIDANTVRYAQNLAEAEVEQATIDALERQKEIIDESLAVERLRASFIAENLKAIQTANNSMLQGLKIARTLTRTEQEHLRVVNQIYETEKRSLEVQRRQIEQKISELDINTETNEQDQNLLLTYQGQLYLLEQQTAQLEQQNILVRALNAEADPETSIFTKKGAGLAAEFFVKKLRDDARELKTTFQSLGEGFADAFNKTFDAAVDNLLEGGEDFGFKVRETLKAGLREAFGEALKSRIRESFAGIFEKGEGEDSTEERTITQLELLIAEIQRNIVALDRNTAAQGGSPGGLPMSPVPGGGGGIMDLFKKNTPGAAPGTNREQQTLGDIAASTERGADTGQEIAGLTGITIEAVDAVKAAAQGDTQSLISLLISLGGQLITAILTSNATSSIPGLAMGGIAQGGITPMSTGGMVTDPTMALIGEGRNNEAVVPLPNNREIPVDLRNEGGDTINISQSFDFSNAGPDTVAQLRNESRNIEERTFNRVFAEINKGGKYAKISGRR